MLVNVLAFRALTLTAEFLSRLALGHTWKNCPCSDCRARRARGLKR